MLSSFLENLSAENETFASDSFQVIMKEQYNQTRQGGGSYYRDSYLFNDALFINWWVFLEVHSLSIYL
jgi:hypothetical protein